MISKVRLIEALDCSPDIADTVRGLMAGTVDPFSVPAVADWRRQCYHDPDPTSADTIMKAIDAVLGTSGVEAITGSKVWQRYWTDTCAIYCNAGDTYAATILYNTVTGRYQLGTWGDFVDGTCSASPPP